MSKTQKFWINCGDHAALVDGFDVDELVFVRKGEIFPYGIHWWLTDKATGLAMPTGGYTTKAKAVKDWKSGDLRNKYEEVKKNGGRHYKKLVNRFTKLVRKAEKGEKP